MVGTDYKRSIQNYSENYGVIVESNRGNIYVYLQKFVMISFLVFNLVKLIENFDLEKSILYYQYKKI